MDETILIVEDEKELGELVRDYLKVEGYNVILAFDGAEALNVFQREAPLLIVLDIMLPKIDGIEVCRTIRSKSNVPILLVSAKKSETDKIIGLGIGADDYITKPFSPGELVARIKAHLRRYNHYSSPKEIKKTLAFGELEIDEKGFMIKIAGIPVDFSAKEFQLLHFLATNKGQVFSKEQLFDKVWGYDSYGDMNAVTVYVRKIREKIEGNPSKPKYIKTVWGVGYKFDGGTS
ncbi:DNA-binding response regulator [Anaerobacillus arseniciselenatis]|uniref:DNA-binding response regulator n=1 Tax=Anaerobacillus arseniciselenatis TaxID=85682 RepID=A0A1S2LU60_9BACI|nr:response regulator transcription factor [Anaerobacillus arseniciselenatis]OIJ15207.1 DNA-binding response regulator [Anaerobacillus arseniciselenatis]